MYTKALFAVAFLSLVQPASGQVTPPPVLEVAGPTTFEAGKKAVIKVTTTAKKVSWKIPPGCDTEALDGRRLAVWANPGTYLFVAMVPVGDDVVTIDYPVTITQGPRPPPGPVPPVDEFAKAVHAAYAADVAPDKRERLRAFTEVMRNAATAADNTAFKTNAELAAAVSKSTRETIADSLTGVRKEIGKYLNAQLPTDVVTLTADHRAKAKAAYTYIANTLGGIE